MPVADLKQQTRRVRGPQGRADHVAGDRMVEQKRGLSDVKSLTSMARPGVRAAVKSCEKQSEA